MSGYTHTAGPWEACAPGDYGDFDGESRVVTSSDLRIAVVHWHEGDYREENDANAQLIATAPDLLSAAQAAIEIIAESWGAEQLEAGDCQAINVLRAAITKATA